MLGTTPWRGTTVVRRLSFPLGSVADSPDRMREAVEERGMVPSFRLMRDGIGVRHGSLT
jgi:hypothetical protein